MFSNCEVLNAQRKTPGLIMQNIRSTEERRVEEIEHVYGGYGNSELFELYMMFWQKLNFFYFTNINDFPGCQLLPCWT